MSTSFGYIPTCFMGKLKGGAENLLMAIYGRAAEKKEELQGAWERAMYHTNLSPALVYNFSFDTYENE